jgi:hypothetical protein
MFADFDAKPFGLFGEKHAGEESVCWLGIESGNHLAAFRL